MAGDDIGEIGELIERLTKNKDAMRSLAEHTGEVSALTTMVTLSARVGDVETVHGLCCTLFSLGYQARAKEPDREIWG